MKQLAILFIVVTAVLSIFYFYREAVTGGMSSIERLMIWGPWFVLGFIGISAAYVIGKKKMEQEDAKLQKFRSNFLKLLLVYGLIFVIFMMSVLIDFLG
jgi:hypothetical protein